MAKNPYRIAVIPGDGIGKEVIPAAVNILKTIQQSTKLEFEFIDIPGGGEYYMETGEEWPDGSFEICRDDVDATLLGALIIVRLKVIALLSKIQTMEYYRSHNLIKLVYVC